MGVHGLWGLLEPAGKPVPLETLENKILAVDVSIWLHQLMKGFQDNRGSPLPNAHLLGLFHRVCKLLFYRIKPVFVFDGGVPVLKKQTIIARRQNKSKASHGAEHMREQLLKSLIKSKAVRRVLGEKSNKTVVSEENPREDSDMFKLPPMLQNLNDQSDSEEDIEVNTALPVDSDSESDHDAKTLSPSKLRGLKLDLHSLDVNSEEFLSLPPDVRHDILSELKETRKQNSWGRLHEMPKESGDFSSFQIGRLLKRRNVQVSLEQAEKEMGGKVLSLNELQDLMSAQGVDIANESKIDSSSRRIASDAATRFLLISESTKRPDVGNKSQQEKSSDSDSKTTNQVVSVPEFQDNWSSDEETSEEVFLQNLSSESSDLTQNQILTIIQSQNKKDEEVLKLANSCPKIIENVKSDGLISDEKLVSEESDSDEFQEVASHCKSSLRNVKLGGSAKSKDVTSFEVVISTKNLAIEEDIFADIFNPHSAAPKASNAESSNVQSTPVVKINVLHSKSNLPQENGEEEETTKPADHGDALVKSKLESIAESNKSSRIEKKIENLEETSEEEYDEYVETPENDTELVEHSSTPASQSSNMSTAELITLEESLLEDQKNLQAEIGRQERLAASVTQQMCTDAQELLQLFGVPYIVAPMEAEAQCAFLDAISLTEGTITDDSDIWLFGGRKVYKNFFNQKKHVLQYTSTNIEHYFKLTRHQMIQLALLVGSDYTTGLPGVGPVTALEILATFASAEVRDSDSVMQGLRQFRDWWFGERPQQPSFTHQLKKKLKDLKIAEGFPSKAVVDAYLKPTVDESQETFSWGQLDLPALREFARHKFGWSAAKVDEILLPVAKRWTDKKSQRLIDSYFALKPNLVEGRNKMSKRVQKAVKRMGAIEEDTDSESIEDPLPSKADPKRARKKQSLSIERKENTSRATGSKIKSKELPVRAPQVPRPRTATGVRRVGVKKATNSEFSVNFVQECSENKGKVVKNSSSVSETVVKIQESDETSENCGEVDSQPGVSGLQKQSVSSAVKRPYQVGKSYSSSSEDEQPPGKESENVSNFDHLLNDPWDDVLASVTPHCEQQQVFDKPREKLFFGGIRANKKRKTTQPLPLPPSERQQNVDSRGMRPGWRTDERLQRRDSQSLLLIRNTLEVIPQRERDRKAREEAKMKAIQILKASGSFKASKILGRVNRSSRRGKGQNRPTRKELPEHNLSESSSDDN